MCISCDSTHSLKVVQCYTLTGKKFLKKLGLSSLGLNFSGYTLLTFSPLKYLDPESDPNRFGDYPLIKVYSFGLNLNF